MSLRREERERVLIETGSGTCRDSVTGDHAPGNEDRRSATKKSRVYAHPWSTEQRR